MTTPHISAQDNDFAPTVLMPGDPKRAEWIANNFFENPKLVTEVRAMQGWTGTYNGKPISVMGSGMGMPSMSIYAYELIHFYGVKKLIRVGTCGSVHPALSLGDIVLAMSAHTDSNINISRLPGGHYAPTASYPLLRAAVEAAENLNLKPNVGTILSSDIFYSKDDTMMAALESNGTLAIEMEAAALYGIATDASVEALAILTVSDLIRKRQAMPSSEREQSLRNMVQIALEASLF